MSPKKALVQTFTELLAAMDLSPHEMLGFMFHAMVIAGFRCNEVRGGSTLVARR